MVQVKRQEKLQKPLPITDTKLGPGPLPLPTMSNEDFKKFWLNFKEKYGCFADAEAVKLFPKDGSLEAFLDRELANPTMTQAALYGALSSAALDGILHRSTVELDGAGAIELTKDTTRLISELLHLNPGTRIALQDGGGHGAGYNIWINILAKDKKTPVVVLDFGAFGDQWATDLDTEFAKKGFIGKVVRVRVADGEVPGKADIEKALKKEGVKSSQKFNMLFTSHETGTGAMVNPELMEEFRNWERVDKIVSDFTSAVLCQEIPGIGGSGKQVFGFGALQKVPRGPNLGLVIIPPGHDDVMVKDGKLPNPKYTSFVVGNGNGAKIKETLFSGEDITRSLSMQDILRLNFSVQHLLNMGGLEASISNAQRNSALVQAEINKRIEAANGKPEMIFLVGNPKNRGAFNIVLKKGPGMADVSLEQLQVIKKEARKILAAEGLARNIGPYPKGDPEAIFRFTTLGINTAEDAKRLVDALYYGLAKARHKQVELVAAEQFLYSNQEDMEAAIIRKKADLAKQGIEFIDARKLEVDYKALQGNKRYVVYKPALIGDEITREYEKIRDAGITDNALIIAAKPVSPDAKFSIFVKQGAGTDDLPKAQAAQDGHIVVNCPGVNSAVTSHNTLNAIASHAHIQWLHENAMNGKASANNLKAVFGRSPEIDKDVLNKEVQGKTVAVLGTGNLATLAVKSLLESSAIKIKVYGRKFTESDWSMRLRLLPENLRKKLVLCGNINDALKGADIVVNHLALEEGVGGTRGLVGKEQLDLLANGARIVDSARPGIIDADALIAAHKSGKIANVTVDFDTPDKAPNDESVKKLFNYAKELHVAPHGNSTFRYSPHAFADTDPVVREQMLDNAIKQAAEVRCGEVYNYAGIGNLPDGYKDMGQRKPEGVESLDSFLSGLVSVKSFVKQAKTHVQKVLKSEMVAETIPLITNIGKDGGVKLGG